MKKLILSICAVVATVLGLSSVATLSPAYAIDSSSSVSDWVSGVDDGHGASSSMSLTDLIKQIINVVLGIVGIIAVVMMIVGGISFITSQGDAGKVTKARN